MEKRGRKQKPYQTSWGEVIPGLLLGADGRWKIVATGYRFTESDERLALKRYHEWQSVNQPPSTTTISAPAKSVKEAMDGFAATLVNDPPVLKRISIKNGEAIISHVVDSPVLWHWLRDQLLTQPDYVAKQTGIPELASLARLPLPRPSLKCSEILDTYVRDNPGKHRSKQNAKAAFERLLKSSNAKTLDDLTTEKLRNFRREIESNKNLKSAGTKTSYYNRIKYLIKFGLKVGMDAEQIGGCLNRCKVLWTNDAMPSVDPKPITPEHFQILLTTAGETNWRAWLLLGLNLCMTLEEICGLEWRWFDLEAGTFCCIREKTKRKRIPRAATLWPETVESLRKLPRKSKYVFISRVGSRFSRNIRATHFIELRNTAGLPDTVKFCHLRDGAYTAAMIGAKGSDISLARVLAGHQAAGYEDNYVLRNPAMVKPACDAVRVAYFPAGKPTDIKA